MVSGPLWALWKCLELLRVWGQQGRAPKEVSAP